MTVKWQDADKRGAPGVWTEVLEPLRKTPGVEKRVAVKDTGNAARTCVSQLRTGRLETPSGRWEFRSETLPDKGYVFATYLGPEDE